MFRARLSVGISIGVWLLYATAPAQAATVWYQGAIQLIYPFNDGSFAIGVPSTLPVCFSSGSGSYLYVVPNQNAVTSDGVKSLLATVLTAFSLGRTISIAYDDSSAYCYVNRLLIQ